VKRLPYEVPAGEHGHYLMDEIVKLDQLL